MAMTDDLAPPPESPQIPVSEGLQAPPAEPISEPTPEVSADVPTEPAEPTEPVGEASEVTVEPQSESPTPEPKPGPSIVASAPSTTPTNTPEHDRELLKIARAKIQTRKQQDQENILTLFEKKERITNDDVENLLHCSDATARRYLNELVKQGKIKRIGETGAGVTYVRA